VRKHASAEALGAAVDSLMSFAARKTKRLLLVEADAERRAAVVDLVAGDDVETTEAASGCDALAAVRAGGFECVVIDLPLPDMGGSDLLRAMRDASGGYVPVVLYTGTELPAPEQRAIDALADQLVVKSARSPEQLLEETTIYLHRAEASLGEPKRQMLQRAHASDLLLRGKKVLIVDDDVRNIFAVTSALERHGMVVVFAEDGRAGLDLLRATVDVDAVLMDVMMPGMDGYETMAEIRRMPQFRVLPVIALTAKAMKGDRERCIEAGASDYVTKPVDPEQLLSLLRVWLYAAPALRGESAGLA